MGRTVGVVVAVAGLVAALLATWLTRWMLAVVPNDELHASQHLQTLPQLVNISAQPPEPLVHEAKPLLSLPGPTGSTPQPGAKTLLSYLQHACHWVMALRPFKEQLSLLQLLLYARMAYHVLMVSTFCIAGATVCSLVGVHVFRSIRNKAFTLEPFIMRQTVKEVEAGGAGNVDAVIGRGLNDEGELKDELKGELKGELKDELKGELKDELTNLSAGICAGVEKERMAGAVERELGEMKGRLLKVEAEREAAMKVAAEQATAEKLGEVERELGELKKRFRKVEGEQTAVAKVAAEKADLEKLNGLVGAMQRGLGEVKDRMIKVEGENADAEKVNDLEKVTREGFAAVKGEVAAVKGEVAAVKGEVAAVKGEVAAVKGEVAAVKEKVAAVEGELADQKARLLESEAARDGGFAWKEEVTSVKGEVAAVKGEVAAVNEKVAEVEGELADQKVRLLEEKKKVVERGAHERVKRDAKQGPDEAAMRKILQQPGALTKEQVEECRPS
ncbi:unnamed protein product [Closterium sp. Yama58-4]|nr:unnamed protein product [Closterium sp. Yama58-4]